MMRQCCLFSHKISISVIIASPYIVFIAKNGSKNKLQCSFNDLCNFLRRTSLSATSTRKSFYKTKQVHTQREYVVPSAFLAVRLFLEVISGCLQEVHAYYTPYKSIKFQMFCKYVFSFPEMNMMIRFSWKISLSLPVLILQIYFQNLKR